MALVLLGGGGHASDVVSVIEALVDAGSRDDGPVFIADDAWERPDRFEDRGEVKLVESIAAGVPLGRFVVSIGYPAGRRAVHDLAVGLGGRAAAPLVHPAASIGRLVDYGDGVVVMGQTWVSARVRIGAHAHVGYGATIGHDTEIGAFGSVMPGACVGGDVTVGASVLVGANATVLQGVAIGEEAVIGAGATVVRDVEPGTTVVGTPAAPLLPGGRS